jgi:hypothetical protein
MLAAVVMTLPKQASPSPGDTEPRQISDSAVLVRVDLDD